MIDNDLIRTISVHPKPTHRTVGVVEAVGWMLQHLEKPIEQRGGGVVFAWYAPGSDVAHRRIVVHHGRGCYSIDEFILIHSRAAEFLIPIELRP